MTGSRRKGVLVAVMAGLLAVLAIWSCGQLLEAQAEADRAGEDLASCRKLAARIERLQARPNRAGATEMEQSVMAAKIDQAARSAEMPPKSVVRIWPEPARRLGDTVYKEKPTQVLLRNVGRKQLTTFLHALTGDDSELAVRSLRLSAPRERRTEDVWNAEAVITYLIYAPTKPARSGEDARGMNR